MRDVVTWESIVGNDFLDRFKEIALAEYWTSVKDIPFDTLYKKFSDMEIEKYREKRRMMRYHGWRKSFLNKQNEIRFGTMYNPQESNYINLADYIDKRRADEALAIADDYYRQQDLDKQVSKMARHFRIDKDDVFVTEEGAI